MQTNETKPSPSGKSGPQKIKPAGNLRRDINLLPAHNDAGKTARNVKILAALVLGAAALAYLAFILPSAMLKNQQDKAAAAEADAAANQHFETEFNRKKDERDALQQMQASLKDVSASYEQPSDLFDDLLARTCPNGVTLLTVENTPGGLKVAGRAADDRSIAAFLTNLKADQRVYGTALISAKDDAVKEGGQGRLFELSASLMPTPAPEAAAAAADAAANGGSGQ